MKDYERSSKDDGHGLQYGDWLWACPLCRVKKDSKLDQYTTMLIRGKKRFSNLVFQN